MRWRLVYIWQSGLKLSDSTAVCGSGAKGAKLAVLPGWEGWHGLSKIEQLWVGSAFLPVCHFIICWWLLCGWELGGQIGEKNGRKKKTHTHKNIVLGLLVYSLTGKPFIFMLSLVWSPDNPQLYLSSTPGHLSLATFFSPPFIFFVQILQTE